MYAGTIGPQDVEANIKSFSGSESLGGEERVKGRRNKRERTVPATAERHHDGRHRDALW